MVNGNPSYQKVVNARSFRLVLKEVNNTFWMISSFKNKGWEYLVCWERKKELENQVKGLEKDQHFDL